MVIWRHDSSDVIAKISDCEEHDISSCQQTLQKLKYGLNGSLDTGISFVIHNLSLEDDGVYACKVISADGYGKSIVRLTVIGKYTFL